MVFHKIFILRERFLNLPAVGWWGFRPTEPFGLSPNVFYCFG